MTNRVRQLWLPGLLTLVLSMVLLALILILEPRDWMHTWRGHLPLALDQIVWLLALPLIGAVGAYLSYRAGGSARAMVTSAVFPVVPLLASFLIVLPVSLAFDHFIAHNIAPVSLLKALPWFVLSPGIALLAGGLPAAYFLSRRLDSRRIARG